MKDTRSWIKRTSQLRWTVLCLLVGGVVAAVLAIREPGVFRAAREDDVQTVVGYLERGGDPNAARRRLTRVGYVPLPLVVWAAEARATRVVEVLLSRGAFVEVHASHPWHPAWSAMEHDDGEMMAMLLKHGVDVEADSLGNSIMDWAMMRGKWNVVAAISEQRPSDFDWGRWLAGARWDIQGASASRTAAVRTMVERGMSRSVEVRGRGCLREIATEIGDVDLCRVLSLPSDR